MKKQITKSLLALLLALSSCFTSLESAAAAQPQSDSVYDDGQDEDTDTGDVQEESLTFYYGDKGTLPTPSAWTDSTGASIPVTSAAFTLTSGEANVLSMDAQGNYEVTGVGTAEAEGKFYDALGRLLLTKTYHITAKVDMTGVTLDKTSATSYVQQWSNESPQFEFQLKPGSKPLPSGAYGYEVSCRSSNSKISAGAYMSAGNTVVVYTMGTGTTTVTLTINEKDFKVKLKIIEVGMNKNSLLLTPKQTSQLKVTGLKKDIKWSSSNSRVVKVTSGGKVTALKNGNAVIKAKIGDFTVGCAVSVVSTKRYKTIKQAIRIGKTCSYSQPRRMQKGYYDCSSLTWRAYKLSGITFGNKTYAPVAASQALWCVQRKKNIKGGLSAKNVKNMKLNAGDLMFLEGSKNGRYRGIYHVEMISGYVCCGFDKNGNPILGITYANRPDNNYAFGGQLVGRP